MMALPRVPVRFPLMALPRVPVRFPLMAFPLYFDVSGRLLRDGKTAVILHGVQRQAPIHSRGPAAAI